MNVQDLDIIQSALRSCTHASHRAEAEKRITEMRELISVPRELEEGFAKIEWLAIQSAVGDSDIEPEDFRQRLLDKIGVKL